MPKPCHRPKEGNPCRHPQRLNPCGQAKPHWRSPSCPGLRHPLREFARVDVALRLPHAPVHPAAPAGLASDSALHAREAETPQTIDGKPNYNFGPVKFVSLAALFWGVAGLTVGLYIALELAFPALNLDLPCINFGRLRPLHTSAVIFAFGGNVLLATSFYVVQRTCRARLAGDLAPWFVALGYNFFIVIAGTGYLLGITRSQGIRRAGMVRRPVPGRRLGHLSAGLPRHAGAAQRAAHLCRQLVLSRLHRHDRRAAHRQQRRDAGLDLQRRSPIPSGRACRTR